MLKSLVNEIVDNSIKNNKNIKPSWLSYLKQPKCITTVQFPLERNDGQIETITGTRIIHSNHNLPSKGGLKMSTQYSVKDLEALSSIMTYKAALFQIPFGGAKGCININPDNYSSDEIERVIRRFTIEMWKRSLISPSTDVMSPEDGTTEKHMNIIRDTYAHIKSSTPITEYDAVVTGKSSILGGLEMSKYSHGWGISRICDYIERVGIDDPILSKCEIPSGSVKKSLIVHNFNTKGYYSTRSLQKNNNHKIIGITKDTFGCYNSVGFDYASIHYYLDNNNNSLEGISKKINDTEEVINKKCDYFISFAPENSITAETAEKINCRVFIEATNHPLTKGAMAVFERRGIIVIPDLLANSGSYICGYLEWLKNLEHKNLTLLMRRFELNSRNKLIGFLTKSDYGVLEEEYKGTSENELVLSTIEELICAGFDSVLNTSKETGLDLRHAAYRCAIERIYEQNYQTDIL